MGYLLRNRTIFLKQVLEHVLHFEHDEEAFDPHPQNDENRFMSQC